ncbi:hypothetical protein ACO0M4_13180 [Streptomyces sp. RGM 3693]|uniref:hypothetical protein n=1 Tax=Streptomyces sp. RGM 3693 TaxID=3413284 RepID=UPI003D2A7562
MPAPLPATAPAPASGSPIYESLVSKHGDVVAESRRVAQETQQEADRLLHFAPRDGRD